MEDVRIFKYAHSDDVMESNDYDEMLYPSQNSLLITAAEAHEQQTCDLGNDGNKSSSFIDQFDSDEDTFFVDRLEEYENSEFLAGKYNILGLNDSKCQSVVHTLYNHLLNIIVNTNY